MAVFGVFVGFGARGCIAPAAKREKDYLFND